MLRKWLENRLLKTILSFILICKSCLAEKINLKKTNFEEWDVSNTCKGAWFLQKPYMRAVPGSFIESCALESPYWVNSENVSRLIIEITLRTLYCPTCSEHLSLQLYQGRKDDIRVYRNISNLPYKLDKPINNETVFVTTNVVTVDGIKNNTGFQFRFPRGNYEGQIESFLVQYESCPTVRGELVDFKSQPAPDIIERALRINGECAKNAQNFLNDTIPVMTCEYNGNYTIQGNCVCEKGYTKENTRCKECEEGYYKNISGNDPCLKCGANVKPGIVPRTDCDCIGNYFRQADRINSKEADCYELPAMLRDIIVTNITSEQATITWEKPHKGSFDLGFFMIRCDNCPPYRNEFPVKTMDFHITVKNLAAYAKYKLKIHNENIATNLTQKVNEAEIEFLTHKGVPGKVTDVTNTSDSNGNVVFQWKPPFALGSDRIRYVIEYGDKTEKIENTFFIIKKDPFDKTYRVRIGTEVVIDGKVLSGPDFTGEIKVPGGVSPVMALGIAAGIIVFVVVALVASFCIWKKRNPAYLQVVRMEDGTVKLPARFYSGGKLYVDPKTFLLVSDAVVEFAYEIERSELIFGELIGSGEFADVHKGVLMKEGKKESVAIKVLKSGASESDREDFLSEAAILGQFSNPNVIFLEGVVLKDEPNLIVLEYMEYGALDSYLKDHDMQFTIEQLLEMARGVASGMKYLSEMGFIHRDLAARNILVNEKKTCKIADFGMSLEIKVEDRLEAKGSKIPVRWTSPEAIHFKKFTTASDVWSYGIVLWEIMSYGERPYWEWNNLEVLEKVNSGYRLPPPMGCPRVVHDLMLNCWEKERSKRPLFSVIRDRIDDWLQIPELLDELGPVVKLDDALDYTIMQTINKWLEAIDMGRYANNFLEQGFATPRQILLLTMDDLEALGIGSLEHRRRVFKAIANTKSQVESNLVRMNSKTGTFRSQSPSK